MKPITPIAQLLLVLVLQQFPALSLPHAHAQAVDVAQIAVIQKGKELGLQDTAVAELRAYGAPALLTDSGTEVKVYEVVGTFNGIHAWFIVLSAIDADGAPVGTKGCLNSQEAP